MTARIASASGGAAALAASAAAAGTADVVAAKATCTGEVCTFTASVRNGDSGWDRYADRFEIVAPDGKVIAACACARTTRATGSAARSSR